jgi:hypothetical protein
VRETVRHRGELVEKTFDWYAPDRRGNVWHPEPDVLEHKLYAKGVGLVLTLGVSGDVGRSVLLPQ